MREGCKIQNTVRVKKMICECQLRIIAKYVASLYGRDRKEKAFVTEREY